MLFFDLSLYLSLYLGLFFLGFRLGKLVCLGKLVRFRLVNFVVMFFLRKFLPFFLVKFGPADQRIGIRARLRFLVLCFHQPRGKRAQLLFA